MKPNAYLGIDTSNYTTSVAVTDEAGEVVANLKAPLPVKEGECGLRQSEAVFSHVKNLPGLMAEAGEILRDYSLSAVGCSVRPRDAEGSYMPCFLAGKAVASAVSATAGVPMLTFSHQNGHLMAALYSSGAADSLLGKTFGAFHVSGGTTELVIAKPEGAAFSVELIGQTNDLNAGQAIDRAGVMMGLRFPAGPALEEEAKRFTGTLPPVKVSVTDRICHLSGLQNLSEKLWKETNDRALVSAFVLEFIGKTLKKMTEQLDEIHPGIPVVYAGGVMSNRILQEMLSSRKNTYFAKPAFSADNAAGISLLCRRKMQIYRNTEGENEAL